MKVTIEIPNTVVAESILKEFDSKMKDLRWDVTWGTRMAFSDLSTAISQAVRDAVKPVLWNAVQVAIAETLRKPKRPRVRPD